MLSKGIVFRYWTEKDFKIQLAYNNNIDESSEETISNDRKKISDELINSLEDLLIKMEEYNEDRDRFNRHRET